MIIDYQVIPHEDQRYPSVGDWVWCFHEGPGDCPFEVEHLEPQDHLHIRVSRLSDPRHELLVFHHELTEALLCREKGVTQEMVDEWDKKYELWRQEMKTPAAQFRSVFPCGCLLICDEPGDDIHAPYYFAHKVATKCERKMAKALEVAWAAYEDEIKKL